MSVLGDIATGIGSFFGARKAASSAEHQTAQNIQFQKDFAQMGIRWRVNDAKKAGVHPLFALGAQTTPFTPNPVVPDDGGLAAVGQAVGSAVEKAGRAPREEEMHRANIRALEAASTRDLAQAQLFASERARLEQTPANNFPDANAGNPYGATDAQMAANPFMPQYGVDWVTGAPDDVVKKGDAVLARSVQNEAAGAGNHPFWRLYQIEGKRGETPKQVYLPYSDEGPAETLQSIPIWLWPIVFEYNVDHLGEKAARRLLEMFPGYQEWQGTKKEVKKQSNRAANVLPGGRIVREIIKGWNDR